MERPQIGSLSLALTAVALLVIASASCAPLRGIGSTAANDHSEQEIRLVEAQLREAALRPDTAALNYFLADDYINTNAYGEVRHKAQVIADLESGNTSIESINLDDINVSLYGDAAVLTATRTVKGTAKGRSPSGQFRQIRVYAKRQGRWQAVMLQMTRMAE